MFLQDGHSHLKCHRRVTVLDRRHGQETKDNGLSGRFCLEMEQSKSKRPRKLKRIMEVILRSIYDACIALIGLWYDRYSLSHLARRSVELNQFSSTILRKLANYQKGMQMTNIYSKQKHYARSITSKKFFHLRDAGVNGRSGNLSSARRDTYPLIIFKIP